jgi:hypothetical protein
VYEQYRIRIDITKFLHYLDELGAPTGANIPHLVPVVGIANASLADNLSITGNLNVMTPSGTSNSTSGILAGGGPGHPCKYQLSSQDTNDDRQVVWLYSACIFTEMIAADARGGGQEALRKVWLSSLFGAYFFCSYYYDSSSECPWGTTQILSDPWFKVLWDLHVHFGHAFTDEAMMYTIQQFNSDPSSDPTETLDHFVGYRIIDGMGVMSSNWPEDSKYIYEVFSRHGIDILTNPPRMHDRLLVK